MKFKVLNQEKEKKLEQERGAKFFEILEKGRPLDVRKNPNYEDQEFHIFFYQDYVWVVVVGINPDRFITLYRSRKLKKEFGL